MAKKLSHDQKRKAKLKKRAERGRRHEVMAYAGAKYQGDEYVPIVFATENGVLESHVLLERSLTDDDVEEAIESLVVQLRGNLAPYPSKEEAYDLPGEPRDLIIANIRRNWLNLLDEDGRGPGRDDLIGVLRTILGSVELRRDPGRESRGYLNYLERFLAKMGVSVRVEKDESGLPPGPVEDAKALESKPETD